MDIVMALIPAVGWGIVPLIVNKTHGKPVNQIVGMGLGAVLIGILVVITNGIKLDAASFLIALAAGALWTVGQIGQFISFTRMGVSTTIPLSTGFQLVGSSLIGVLLFGEWPGMTGKIIGFTALALVIIGVILTSLTDDPSNKKTTTENVLFLLITTIGYLVYSSFPKMLSASGKDLLLPEMLGILAGSLIYMVISKQAHAIKERATWLNVFAGISFGIGSLAYIYSAQANGVASAFIYSQMSSIIATFGGIFLLHEAKTRKEMIYTVVGLFLIVGGSALTSMI